ncbi:tape measure protein [Pseudomonas sp. S32]|uniref:tape measure protein n=1 Tax=Pseudomonas sp. S32 TaxID=2767448 RepID=UPI001F43BD56|nr:tape measure protein [Pseudomonas sp. S32]MBK5004149.1 tape measure protein [Pseudomonas sp. S32]
MADTDVQGMLVRIEATTAQLRQEIARGESAVASTSRRMDSSLARVDDAFDRVGASAQNASGLLKSVLAAAVGAVSVGSILKAADSYSQMSDRIGLATKSFGEYNAVQDRLLATANRTYRPLEEAQELYIRTADSLRSMGLSADESMDVMDSFSYLLVTNSASVDKASSAIDAYSKALQTGKLDADGWQSILAAMPTVVETIAEATGKSAEEIRSFGAQGKLSLDILTEGLQKSAAANGLLADSMGVAVRDALTALNNAFTVYVGQLNESTDLTGVLASGISVLADNFGTITEIAGVAAAGALAVYARSLTVSAAGAVLATKASIEDAAARRAQAAAAVLAAEADQRKAQTAVFLAEKELAASKTRISGMAVEKQLALQLAEARMAEARATAALREAQAGLAGTGRNLLGLLGGPAGIAMLAVGAATAFLTLRDNTSTLEKKLGDLADPIDKLAERFNKLNRATQSVTLRELQATIADTQDKLTQMSGAMADKFESDLRNMGAAGADGMMAGLVGLPADMQATLDLVRKASKDQAAGITVDWKAVADQLRLMPGVTEDMAQALESSQQPVTELSALLQNQKQALDELTGATDDNTRAERENAAAKASAAGEGQKYLEQLQKQLATAQDKTALQAANRFIAENKLLTDEMVVAIRSAAAAKDAQKAADDAATKATKGATGAAKEAATQAKNQAKALSDLKVQADIAIASAEGLAAAYLAGNDRSREFTLKQKVEEALLKSGAGARDAVTAAITRQMAAEDRLTVSKQAFDLQQEATDQTALAKATLQGADALAEYNVQKALKVALAGKDIAQSSAEYEALVKSTRAQQQALELVRQASSANSILDRLKPEQKLLRDYTEDLASLEAAMKLNTGRTAEYQEAIAKLGNEYEINRSKSTLWGQMTEGAIDRVDQAFANAWSNIGSGASTLWGDLIKGFKQTLGEIIHMLTTKPLLASISNWLTGTDNGQGLSSVWGKLLGNGSSGGGTGQLSSLASTGNMLYKVYSAITGVGSSVASGWASGGLSGAINGGYSYYANLFSGLTSSLSSGFSSVVSSILGSTSSQIAANAATSAALQGAVAQGAATVGSSIGVGGAAYAGTAAAGGAAAGVSTGLMGQLAAMASNPVGWVVAAITGAYQSGKLYDQGVRFKTSEVTNLDLIKYDPLAKTMMASLGLTDKIASKLVGGKMAAMLTGSTLASAVLGKVSSALFGGKWQTKDGGFELGVNNGDFQGWEYIYQKKKGGLFSSGKKRTRYSALNPEFQAALEQTYSETQDSVVDLLERIGVSVGEGAFAGLSIARKQISTKGQTQEQIQAAINDLFSGFADQMVAYLDKGVGGFGYSFAELGQRIATFESFNKSLDLIDVAMLKLSPHSMGLANALVTAAGGMEAYTESLNGYFEAFFSETERADKTLSAVRQQFKDMNVVLPETRDAYRKVVESLDLTTDTGQQMYLTLIGAAGNAAQAYDILEARAASAAQAVQEAAARVAATLESNVTAALGSVQRAVNAQKTALTEAYNAQTASLNDMSQTAQKNVSDLTSVSTSLGNAMKALRGDSDDAVKMLRAQALATLNSAMATVRAGKSLTGVTGLEDALSVVSQNNTNAYASLEAYSRDQGRTANIVSQLEAANGKQLTAAEQSVQSLQIRIEQAKKSYDLQIAQYDAQLTLAQAQIDALNGVDNSIVSVATAVQTLSQAITASLSIKADDAARQNTSDNNVALLRAVYQTVLGRDLDGNGLASWGAALANGSLTYDKLAEAIAISGKANGETIRIPGFASGGTFGGGLRLVGERGPELEVTGPSRIYNAGQTAAMLTGGQGEATAAEVRELRAELKSALFAIAKYTQKAAKNTDLLPQKLEQELYP